MPASCRRAASSSSRAAKRGQSAAREHRALRKARAAVAVDAACRFRDHDDCRSRARAAARDAGASPRIPPSTSRSSRSRAVPAGDEREAVRREGGLELGRGRAGTCSRARRPRSPRRALPCRQVSRLVSPPTSGRSSMVQVSGLIPRRTLTGVAVVFVARRQVLACAAFARGVFGDFGDRHVPPGTARGRCRSAGRSR